MIREAAQKHKPSKEKIFNAISTSGKSYSHHSWVSAYWAAAHQAETGDAVMVFMIFADEKVDKLKGYEPTITYRVEMLTGLEFQAFTRG